MRWVLVTLALVLILSSFASAADELFDYHALNLELSLKNDFEIVQRGTSFSVQRVNAVLSWFPSEDYRQVVERITTVPAAEFNEFEGFSFEWVAPRERRLSIAQDSSMTTKNEFLPIREKIEFPLKGVDSKQAIYLQPGEIIDQNQEISSLASRLADGEDDAFIVVTDLAEWVSENIKYDLSTSTADATQKSSWVLEHRKGVCDELTSLFISMCRSLGIPARFVSGISYSNVNLQNDGWGPHGWTEVYFPDVGWVPFDVTYKEYGYIDATHIKLKTTRDAKETSIEYSIIGQNADVSPGSLDFTVDVIGRDRLLKPLVDMDLKVFEEEVGFGSYNLVELSITNKQDYYVTGRVQLANVSELELLSSNRVTYVLPPFENEKFYWLIKVSEDLKGGYVYSFPVSIAGERGQRAEAIFKSAERKAVYSREFMESLIPESEGGEKPYSSKLAAYCYSDVDKVYLGESLSIVCTVKNSADRSLDLNSCIAGKCTTINILPGEERDFEFSTKFDSLGVKTLAFRLDGALASKTAYFVIPVADEPSLVLGNISYPSSIDYSERGEFRFLIKRDSMNDPKNMVLDLEHEIISESWPLPEIESNYELRYTFRGSDLHLGENTFKMTLSYEDDKGKKYFSEKSFVVELNDPAWWQKVLLWLHAVDVKLTRFINGLFE